MEYPGAIYHVINRGNYRRDLFESAGTAEAFVEALEETVGRHGWRTSRRGQGELRQFLYHK